MPAPLKHPHVAFWAKATKPSIDVCWDWMASIGTSGYGSLRFSGQTYYAHRLAWEYTFGPVPHGQRVLHHCDNRKCINPDHLFLGSGADNSLDMFSKARHPRQILTVETARQLRARANKGESRSLLAQEFGVRECTVYDVANGRSWGWA